MFCGKCGNQVEDGIKFCGYCGNDLCVTNNAGMAPQYSNQGVAQYYSTPVTEDKKKDKSKSIIIILIIIIVALILGGGAFIFFKFYQNDSANDEKTEIVSVQENIDETNTSDEMQVIVENDDNALNIPVTSLAQISDSTKAGISKVVMKMAEEEVEANSDIISSDREIVEYRFLKNADSEKQNDNKLCVIIKDDLKVKTLDGGERDVTRYLYLMYDLNEVDSDGYAMINPEEYSTSDINDGFSTVNLESAGVTHGFGTYDEVVEKVSPSDSNEYFVESNLLVDISELKKPQNADIYKSAQAQLHPDGRISVNIINTLTVELDGEPYDGQKIRVENGYGAFNFEIKLVKDNPVVQRCLNNSFVESGISSLWSYPEYYMIVEGLPVETDEYLDEESPYFYILGEESKPNMYEVIYIVPYIYELKYGYCNTGYFSDSAFIDENTIIKLCPYNGKESTCYWNSEVLDHVAGGDNKSLDDMKAKFALWKNTIGFENLYGYAKVENGIVYEFIESHMDNY